METKIFREENCGFTYSNNTIIRNWNTLPISIYTFNTGSNRPCTAQQRDLFSRYLSRVKKKILAHYVMQLRIMNIVYTGCTYIPFRKKPKCFISALTEFQSRNIYIYIHIHTQIHRAFFVSIKNNLLRIIFRCHVKCRRVRALLKEKNSRWENTRRKRGKTLNIVPPHTAYSSSK